MPNRLRLLYHFYYTGLPEIQLSLFSEIKMRLLVRYFADLVEGSIITVNLSALFDDYLNRQSINTHCHIKQQRAFLN